jgi:hypothetical protein
MSIALLSLWVAVAAVAATTAITAGLRAFSALDGGRRERYRRRISEELAAYAVGATEEPPPAPRGRLQQCVMHAELARLVPNLKRHVAVGAWRAVRPLRADRLGPA